MTPNTLLFNMNALEAHTNQDFAGIFPGVTCVEGKHLQCSGCKHNLGYAEAMNPLELSAASMVSTQVIEQNRRVAEIEGQDKITYSLFTSKLHEFASRSASEFTNRLKICIFNHCIEDRQKNLALMAHTPTVCRIITIKPLSHLAYVISESDIQESEVPSKPGKPAPRKFTESNKVLYSQMRYDLSGQNETQASGLIDFVKQISSVRRITDEEYEVS